MATPSMFSSNETENPEIKFNPIIWLIGAITPPANIAPSNHGRSRFPNCWLFDPEDFFLVTSEYNNNPRNAPKYKRPANVIGEISLSSSLANGELSPNNEADIKMYRIGFLFKVYCLHRGGYDNIVVFVLNIIQLEYYRISDVYL